MAEKTAPRVTRLLGIVTYLERHGEATVAELAERFGVTEAQVRKDVELLWVSGVPGHAPQDLIDFDAWAFDEDIIRLTNSQGVGQVRLSPREAVALIGALTAVVAGGAAPEAAHTALEKLRNAVGDGDAVRATGKRTLDAGIVEALTDAMTRGVVAEVDYIDAGDRRSTRTIEPHRLVVIDGLTYIECFCHRAADYRTLRVDRMRAVTVGEQPIVAPPSEQGGFSLAPQYEAVVRVARPGRWMLEAIPGATCEDEGDTIVARFGVADARAIAARLLTVGAFIKSVSPAPLAAELRAQAQAVLAAQA